MQYPNGIKKTNNNLITHSNRGMSLENDLNATNEYYLNENIAIIHKKPTSITIKKVDYKNNDMIKEAYFKTPSTTDYNGIYKGYYVDFEAKETRSKTSFPLNNIHSHQITHLKKIVEHGGIGFLIVKFTLLNKIYYLSLDKLTYFLDNYESKSIPISFFENYGKLIKESYNPRIDYLKYVEDEINERFQKIN